MELTLFDRPYPFLAFTVAFSIIFASDALFLTLARRANFYSGLKIQRNASLFFLMYVTLAASLVTILNAPPLFGLIYGFSIFSIYDITTLATTDLDPASATLDMVYGSTLYYLTFYVVSKI